MPAAEMDSVEDPPALTEAGLNVAVTPLGAPETVRLTVAALPEVTAVEIVLVPLDPCATDTDAGFALMLKSFTGIVSVTLVLWVLLPSVPVIASV